jgi:hypothetical protein
VEILAFYLALISGVGPKAPKDTQSAKDRLFAGGQQVPGMPAGRLHAAVPGGHIAQGGRQRGQAVFKFKRYI